MRRNTPTAIDALLITPYRVVGDSERSRVGREKEKRDYDHAVISIMPFIYESRPMQAPFQARNDSDAAQTDTARTVAQKRVLADNRPEAVAQRKLGQMTNNSPRVLQQQALSDAIHNSPRMVPQRHEMDALFGGTAKPQGDGAMSAEASPAKREEKTHNTGLPNQLKSMHEAGNSASSSPDSEQVLQSVFTAEGEKQKKIRQWVGTTKKALQENGEYLLLALFVKMAKEDTPTEWNIRETYPVTRLRLRELLDDVDDGPITTVLDENEPTRELRGAKSGTGYKRLAAWDLVARGDLDPATHTEISHVTTSVDWMDKRIDPMHGADTGELGAGFYTVSGHGDVAAKAIRDEFGKTGQVPREVLTFRIENAELGQLVNDEIDLAAFLVFVLQHSSGYPPDTDHMALITRINRIGKALIFPDKTTLVDIDAAGTQFSYDTYRAANGAHGGHSLIVGPQARPSLDGIRQIAARGYLGDKILNEAVRRKSKLGGLNT